MIEIQSIVKVSQLSQYLKNYFYFSRTQRNAIVFLCGLLVLVILAYFAIPVVVQPDVSSINSGFVSQVNDFEESRVEQQQQNIILSFFDPNQIDKEGLMAMGLSEKLASNIVSYRNAGGKFKSKNDVRKMYGMTDSIFQIIEPYIMIQPEINNKFSGKEPEEETVSLFYFDPNTIDDEAWKRLGFSDFKVQNIRNYLNAGGKFRMKEDLKKLFTITHDDYNRVKDFLLLPDSLSKPAANDDKILKGDVTVEINSADTAQLAQLKGIGPALSQRIINYREKLGGFFRKEQLLEVFGIDTLRYKGFENQVIVDVSLIRKMELNKTQFKEMTKHPYLEYHIVKSIFTYKDNKGKFTSVDELQQVDLIYDQLYGKIYWYFFVDSKSK